MVGAIIALGLHVESVIAVTREQFHASAIKLEKAFSRLDGKLCTAWLVLAMFACLLFMNDSRSLSKRLFQQVENQKRHGLKISSSWI